MSSQGNALCIQTATSMRGYRTARILQKLGYDVTMAFFGQGDSLRSTKMREIKTVVDLSKPPDDAQVGWPLVSYKGLKKFFGPEKGQARAGHLLSLYPGGIKPFLKNVLKKQDFELVQVMGYPDGPFEPVSKLYDGPIVFDFRDLATGHSVETLKSNYASKAMQALHIDGPLAKWHKKKWEKHEKLAVEGASGILFPSQEMGDHLIKKHKVLKKKPTCVLQNRPFKEDIPKKPGKRFSEEDNVPSICYIGAVATTGYRNYFKLFENISNNGFKLHLYITSGEGLVKEYKKRLNKQKNIAFYEPLPQKKLHRELTRYDYGLVPFNTSIDPLHVEFALPNKLYEYLICGCRIIATPIKSIEALNRRSKVGFTYKNDKALINNLKKDWDRWGGKKERVKPEMFTQEEQFPRLKDFYNKVL